MSDYKKCDVCFIIWLTLMLCGHFCFILFITAFPLDSTEYLIEFEQPFGNWYLPCYGACYIAYLVYLLAIAPIVYISNETVKAVFSILGFVSYLVFFVVVPVAVVIMTSLELQHETEISTDLIQKYTEGHSEKIYVSVNVVQLESYCCGVDSYEDYEKFGADVPWSCYPKKKIIKHKVCRTENKKRKCTMQEIPRDQYTKNDVNMNAPHKKQGCRSAYERSMQQLKRNSTAYRICAGILLGLTSIYFLTYLGVSCGRSQGSYSPPTEQNENNGGFEHEGLYKVTRMVMFMQPRKKNN